MQKSSDTRTPYLSFSPFFTSTHTRACTRTKHTRTLGKCSGCLRHGCRYRSSTQYHITVILPPPFASSTWRESKRRKEREREWNEMSIQQPSCCKNQFGHRRSWKALAKLNILAVWKVKCRKPKIRKIHFSFSLSVFLSLSHTHTHTYTHRTHNLSLSHLLKTWSETLIWKRGKTNHE